MLRGVLVVNGMREWTVGDCEARMRDIADERVEMQLMAFIDLMKMKSSSA